MKKLPTKAFVLETLFQQWKLTDQVETVATENALGRVPVNDIYAELSIPVVRASAMDGVAVQSERFQNGMPDTSGWKLGEDFCRADTGDDFDDTFDAVIPIEKVSLPPEGGLIIDPEVSVTAGMSIRPAGSTVQKGDLLVEKHHELRILDLACLSMGGITEVEVYKQPRVVFLPTGSELVPLGAPVKRGNTIDSNSILAKNLLDQMGAVPICKPIVRDDPAAITSALDEALATADIVLLNGGSSKGDEDFNARLLAEKGSVLFHGVAAAPGRPMCIALIDNKPVINIPGPPLAVLYGMDWCIRAMVCRILHKPMPKRQTIQGVLTKALPSPKEMELFCMMDVQRTDNGYELTQRSHRSGKVIDVLRASGLYITKLGQEDHQAGDSLEIELLRGEEDI